MTRAEFLEVNPGRLLIHDGSLVLVTHRMGLDGGRRAIAYVRLNGDSDWDLVDSHEDYMDATPPAWMRNLALELLKRPGA